MKELPLSEPLAELPSFAIAPASRFNRPLPSLRDVHVLVLGDVMLDRYWFGVAERISQEAPVPVVDIAETEDRPGGAANTALNIVSMGARCTWSASLAMIRQVRISKLG